MKNSIFIAVGALTLFLVASAPYPVLGMEQDSSELEELSLYFKADQLVEIATRSPKPLIQVAENVTIITAEEIEAMNAHNVAEILNRVSGIIVAGSYTDFGSSAGIYIQGSDYEHVLVLVDGVRWGYITYDLPETNSIPVQIIKRIEVIRGAASSTWGSSLGGVVNIITKDTGAGTKPRGTLSGTYGRSNSADLRGDAAGRLGPLGYYLYAGYQESDGIRDTRFFENKSLYGKFTLDLPQDMEFGLSLSHSEPYYKYNYYYDDIYADPPAFDNWLWNEEVFFATAFFSAPLGDAFTFNLSVSRLEDTANDIGQYTGDSPYLLLEYEGKSWGASGHLVWTGSNQTVVLGSDFEYRENTDKDLLAPYTADTGTEDIWAFFINDTIRLNRLTLIPGLRYDHISIADDQISPSLGLTYQVSDTTLIRANVSHGFRKPYVGLLTGDSYFHYGINPDLESETIWSYQAGLETAAMPFLRVKLTIFDHEVEDRWNFNEISDKYENNGDSQRRGIELEIETASFYNFSLAANGSVIRMQSNEGAADNHYLANILLKYDDKTWHGQLFGHYVWLGDIIPPYHSDEENCSFIWDLVVGRIFHLDQYTTMEFFAELHNITDVDTSFDPENFPDAGRWFEAGLRFRY